MIERAISSAAAYLARRYGFRSWPSLARELDVIRRRVDRRKQRLGVKAKAESSTILNRLRLGDSLTQAGATSTEVAHLALAGWTFGQSDPQGLKVASARARRQLNRQKSKREPDVHVDYALRALLQTYEQETGKRATATCGEVIGRRPSEAVEFVRHAWPLVIGTRPPGFGQLRKRLAPLIRDLHIPE